MEATPESLLLETTNVALEDDSQNVSGEFIFDAVSDNLSDKILSDNLSEDDLIDDEIGEEIVGTREDVCESDGKDEVDSADEADNAAEDDSADEVNNSDEDDSADEVDNSDEDDSSDADEEDNSDEDDSASSDEMEFCESPRRGRSWRRRASHQCWSAMSDETVQEFLRYVKKTNLKIDYFKHTIYLYRLRMLQTIFTLSFLFLVISFSPLRELSAAFGVPGEGIHKHVSGIALFDFAFTLGLSVVIAAQFAQPPFTTFVTVFLLGQFLHLLFGVETVVVRALVGVVSAAPMFFGLLTVMMMLYYLNIVSSHEVVRVEPWAALCFFIVFTIFVQHRTQVLIA